jgi:hypothetical protein
MRGWWLIPVVLLACGAVRAQWEIENSGTTADLRGIDNVGGGVAWASGTNGTNLRTEDGGYAWQNCTIPPDAEHLDFRGIQAFDANTAIVMSSGKGDLSRLYKTTDGCHTWKLVFMNPDKDGFWDAVVASVVTAEPGDVCDGGSKLILGTILGDPSIHKSNPSDTNTMLSFYLANFYAGITCPKDKLFPSASSIFALPGETAFAASNSILARLDPVSAYWMAVGRRLIQYRVGSTLPSHYAAEDFCDIGIPFSRSSSSAGVFSFAIRPDSATPPVPTKIGALHWKTASCQKADMVAVGGDYQAIDNPQNTAAFTGGSNKFTLAQTPPHGYRSAVAYDAASKTWITVGPNGTDISTDDGKNWRALHPDVAMHEAPDADRNWNALSLPFVVGPHGRIGKLNAHALGAAKTGK